MLGPPCLVLASASIALTLAGCASLKNFPGKEGGPRTTANEPPPALRPPPSEPPRPTPSPPVTTQAPAVPPQSQPPVAAQTPPPQASAAAQPHVTLPPTRLPASVTMPTLPLTQIDDRLLAADLDNHTFAITFAQPVAIRDLLLLLVRGTSLSMIPDPGISGSFLGELKNVTVRQALGLVLQPLGLVYKIDGGFIRVFKREPETRLFDINYVATGRTSTVTIGTGANNGSVAQVSSSTATDMFADLTRAVQALLSERATFSLDRKAGLLQVIDFPERLDRVAEYLEAVHDRVHRQVQIDVRVVEVELKNAAAQTIDWNAVAPMGPPPRAGGSPALTSVRVTDVARLLTALEGQGKVTTIAGTRLRALNNETAIVRALADVQARRTHDPATDPVPPDGLTVTVTPQIGSDGSVMLSLSPMLTIRSSDADGKPAGGSSGGADMLARLADGETIVVAGFGQILEMGDARTGEARRNHFGRSTGVPKRRTEVVILLTPTILHSIAE